MLHMPVYIGNCDVYIYIGDYNFRNRITTQYRLLNVTDQYLLMGNVCIGNFYLFNVVSQVSSDGLGSTIQMNHL